MGNGGKPQVLSYWIPSSIDGFYVAHSSVKEKLAYSITPSYILSHIFNSTIQRTAMGREISPSQSSVYLGR